MRQKMGVLGPVGTHSEAAALYLMAWQRLDCEIVCFGDIGECLHAAEIVGAASADAGWAAICTRRAGELNGLVEIAGKIEDRGSNCTRFFEVVRDGTIPPPAEKNDTVLLVCQIDGTRAGALYDVLGEFARRFVNLTRIESRPARTELGAYMFFFDLDAHSDADAVRASIDAVAEKSVWLKVLGAFPVHMAHNE